MADAVETSLVCCCLPDKLGGVFSYVQNLIVHSDAARTRYRVVLTDNRAETDTRSADAPGSADVERVKYELPGENLYAVLHRVQRAIGTDPGVLLANGWIELAAVTDRDCGKAVIFVVHGDFDYYYGLALRHQAAIDAFVTYTDVVAAKLRLLLPHRVTDMHNIPYGVAIGSSQRVRKAGPLRLLYVGRMHREKGVFLIPAIDARLRAMSIEVTWTMQGEGPDREALQRQWSPPHVSWSGQRPAHEVLALYPAHDVFVLPSEFEALPVALLEAGAAGVVPVASDLPSGIPEVVTNGETGFRVPVGDVDEFARRIAMLASDPAMTDRMSAAVRARVTERFDARRAAILYQDLFVRGASLRRPRPRRLTMPYGSRLDRRWLPNGAVRLIRRVRAAAGH